VPISCKRGATDAKVEVHLEKVKENEDGSRKVFSRSPDGKTLTVKRIDVNGDLILMTIYRMNEKGDPRGCKIYDAKGDELFRVRYGYDKKTGHLVEEQMFDSRMKRVSATTGKEYPIRRFIYTYDEQGKRLKPLVHGEEGFDDLPAAAPSALEGNPFDEGVR